MARQNGKGGCLEIQTPNCEVFRTDNLREKHVQYKDFTQQFCTSSTSSCASTSSNFSNGTDDYACESTEEESVCLQQETQELSTGNDENELKTCEDFMKVARERVNKNPYESQQMCIKAFSTALRQRLAEAGWHLRSDRAIEKINFVIGTTGCTDCAVPETHTAMCQMADILVSGSGADCLDFSMNDGIESVEQMLEHLRHIESEDLREQIEKDSAPNLLNLQLLKVDEEIEISSKKYHIDVVID